MTFIFICLLLVGYFSSGVLAAALAWKMGAKDESKEKMTDLLVLTFALGYFSLIGLGALVLIKRLVRELVLMLEDNKKIWEDLKKAKEKK